MLAGGRNLVSGVSLQQVQWVKLCDKSLRPEKILFKAFFYMIGLIICA